MKLPWPRGEPMICFTSLMIGALGAPLFHVGAAFISPQGFANLRGDRVWATPIILLIVWLWSAAHTAVIGGIAWPLLHRKGWDGFIAYSGIAVLSAFGVSFLLSGDPPSWDLLTMALLNALAARLTELQLKGAWNKRNGNSAN